MTTAALTQISTKIKALEKKTINNVVLIGRLLQEAADQCKHGQYKKWLKAEFAWSQQTAMNYRDIYALSQNPKILDFDKLDISISALLLIKEYILDQTDPDSSHDEDELAKGMAVIEAARQRRVSYKEANKIIDEIERRKKDDEIDDDKDNDDKDDDPEPNDDGPEPEPEPEPDDDDSGDDEEELTTEKIVVVGLRAILEAETKCDWMKVIKMVGADEVREVIDKLTDKLNQYTQDGHAKTKAYLAEAASRQKVARVKRKRKEKENLH